MERMLIYAKRSKILGATNKMSLLKDWGNRSDKNSQIALFFYSSGNILGCCLALAGIGLLVAGIIDFGWPFIVGGLYGIGYLSMEYFENDNVILDDGRFNEDNILQALDETIRSIGARLPEQACQILNSIKETVAALIPAMKALEANSLDFQSKNTLMSSVTKYLPTTLGSYLRLPSAFAKLHSGSSGKTAQVLLVEQLTELDGQLKNILKNVYAKDLEKLEVNGRFLVDRFTISSNSI